VKGLSWGISIITHPLFMATYLLLLVLAIDPYLFGVNAAKDMMTLVLIVFFSTFLIPSVATLLMIQLDLAKSFTMEDRMDRTGPLIASGIFYLWIFWNLYSRADIPRIYVALTLGVTIGLFVVFFFNIFFKISAHMTGMGGWIAAVILMAGFEKYQYVLVSVSNDGGAKVITLFNLLAISFVIAGLVGGARLYLKAHKPDELVYGFLGGMASMFIAYFIII